MSRELVPMLLAGAVPAAAVLAVFLVLRRLLDRRPPRRQQRWTDPDGEELLPLTERMAATRGAPGWQGRLDSAFHRLILNTGLSLSAEQALAWMTLLTVGLAGVLVLWRGELWPALPGLVVGVAGPLLIFRFLAGRRQRRLQDQLPDAFFLLARSLRAGLSLEEALVTVGQQGVRPLADEFGRCVGYFQLGLPAPAALQLLARRLGLADLNGLVALVTLHRTSGGNLPFLLDRWAASTRDRNQFRGYFRAATALGVVNAVALAAAPPLLLVGYWFLEPTYLIDFVQSRGGAVTLAVAGVLEVVGAVWVYYLSRIDY